MSKQRRAEPWKNVERHHCPYCNVWMGSDRQSILLHENGKKHKENVEKNLLQKRQDRATKESNAAFLQASLRTMEAAARQSYAKNDDMQLYGYAESSNAAMDTSSSVAAVAPTSSTSSSSAPPPPPLRSASASIHTSSTQQQQAKQERKEWMNRKKQRETEKRKNGDGEEEEEEDEEGASSSKKRPKIEIELGQGHYSHEGKTYLEGEVFGDILEEEMPIQLWTGSALAGASEKKLWERHAYWKDGIVAAVRRQRHHGSNNNNNNKPHEEERKVVVDVAYLQSPDALEETLETSVPLTRIRIVLGSDPSIPDSLEEARLMAMGGEEIVVCEQAELSSSLLQPQGGQLDQASAVEVDEATGLSSWSTVRVKRTTVRQELKEERDRLRQQRRQAALEQQRQEKLTEERKMEEAKLANADDSALGAYDVWNQNTTQGYKGVDIHGEAEVNADELGRKLADGKVKVGFKKTAAGFQKSKTKKMNRRTTSADDD